ncbi:MAG: hypothetical protein ACREUA_04180 [Burkholderiales bacterium]
MIARFLVYICAMLFLGACGGIGNRSHGQVQTRGFSISSVAKTDIDMVSEIHLRETLDNLRLLMEKLYRRNPREWKKNGYTSIEQAVARVFDAQHRWNFTELEGRKAADAIFLAFHEDFQGDRVQAFIVGLATMIIASYNDKLEFYIMDELDPQKLYNSARNVEIAAWKLSNARDGSGEPYLVSNALDADNPNLSFERTFGKIIGQQDTLAKVIADKTNRQIKNVIQNMATAVFLPI